MIDASFKKKLVALAFILFSIFVVGIAWLLTGSSSLTVSATLSYAAGLSMIVLPCTLPLVFIIVPLSMEGDAKKGFMTAVMFGLGVTIMITIYGIAVAGIGQYLGLDRTTRFMFIIAGGMAYLFGLSELGLMNVPVPGWHTAAPKWVQTRGDYLKPFFMGLFLGNAGVGCPNPAFYVLLTYIASVGSYANGAFLGFLHGLGRATPLLFIAVLAILGVNAAEWLMERKEGINRFTGWSLVLIGAFIFIYGLYGMNWWEGAFIHREWQNILLRVAPGLAEIPDHPVAQGVFKAPIWAGWVTLLALFELPAIQFLRREEVPRGGHEHEE